MPSPSEAAGASRESGFHDHGAAKASSSIAAMVANSSVRRPGRRLPGRAWQAGLALAKGAGAGLAAGGSGGRRGLPAGSATGPGMGVRRWRLLWHQVQVQLRRRSEFTGRGAVATQSDWVCTAGEARLSR